MREARENPFAVARIHALPYRAPGFSRKLLLERFEQQDRRGALVGPQGQGKTTLLTELAADLQQRGEEIHWLRLNETVRQFAPQVLTELAALPPHAVVIVDGAEQLTWWRWRLFLRHLPTASGCLISTHRPGRLPTLWKCHSSLATLQELVEELQGPLSPPQQNRLASLFQQHQGDIRQCLRTLYDWFAEERWS